MRQPSVFLTIAIAAAAVFLPGCTSVPPADAELARAKSRIDQAQQAGAADAAPIELESSMSNLRKGEAAAAEGNNKLARDLATRAELDAALAEAKSRSRQANDAATEVQKGAEQLRDEANRSQTVSEPPRVTP